MKFNKTVQAMQKLGSNVVREGKGILKKKRKQQALIHYIMNLIIWSLVVKTMLL